MKRILFCLALLLFCSPVQASYRELIESVKAGNLSGVLELLDNGEDVNAANEQGNTALHYAVALDNADMTQVLLAYGADLNAANQKGWTPYSIAQKKQVKNVAPVIEKALQQQKDKVETAVRQSAASVEKKAIAVEKVAQEKQETISKAAEVAQNNVVKAEKTAENSMAAVKEVVVPKTTVGVSVGVEAKPAMVENKSDVVETKPVIVPEIVAEPAIAVKPTVEAKPATVKTPAQKAPLVKNSSHIQKTVLIVAPKKPAKPTVQTPKKVVLQKSKLTDKIYAGDEEIVYCLNYLGHGENESMLHGAGFFAASAGISEARYNQIVAEVEGYLTTAKPEDLGKRNTVCGQIITPKNTDKQNQIIRSINRGIGE